MGKKATASKAALFARKAGTKTVDVEIDDAGTVTVRGLSREEVKAVREENASAHTFENRLIAAALVEPKLTPEEVAEWLDDAPAGDSVAVMDAVSKLSGMAQGAQKSSLP